MYCFWEYFLWYQCPVLEVPPCTCNIGLFSLPLKIQCNACQYLGLKWCFYFKYLSLFFLHFSHLCLHYFGLDSCYSFLLPPKLWEFVSIPNMHSSKYVINFFVSMSCFVLVLKFASEILLNKYQRQGLRLLLNFPSQDITKWHWLFPQYVIMQTMHVSQCYPSKIPIYIFSGDICLLL